MLSPDMNVNSNFDDFELDAREREVLELLSTDQNACFSFQGLRRRLGLHQETLARTLKRLEEAQVIEKSPQGYKLRGSGNSFSILVHNDEAAFGRPIIDAYLPAQVDVTVLFQKLRGRWFSNFRWLGYSQNGNHLSMSWISEEGQMQLQARISRGKITILTNSQLNQQESEQIAAAYQLFDHISKVAEEIMNNIQAPLAN